MSGQKAALECIECIVGFVECNLAKLSFRKCRGTGCFCYGSSKLAVVLSCSRVRLSAQREAHLGGSAVRAGTWLYARYRSGWEEARLLREKGCALCVK